MKAKLGKQLVNLLPLLLFVLLAASVLTVLLTGAKLYGGLSERDHSSQLRRTAAQYIATKVHQSGTHSMETADFGGVSALVIEEMSGQDALVTRIYCHDGWLRELYTFCEDEDMTADAGEKILPMKNAAFVIDDGLLKVTLTDKEGRVNTLTLHIGEKERLE